MISVIIPYKEDRGWLESALISLWHQTYGEWEAIHAKGNRTQGGNINRGLKRSKGEFIKILHDDDRLPVSSLENLLEGIEGFDFVCGRQETFGDLKFCPNPQVYKGQIPTFEGMLEGNQIYGGTTLYRKEILESVGGYNEELWTGEEYDLHLRLLKNGYKCNYIPKVVHYYRLHEKNKSYYMGPGEKKKRREFIKEIASWYR